MFIAYVIVTLVAAALNGYAAYVDFIRSEWRVTDNNRRARYYSLTARGRRYLDESLAQWRRMSRAINLVLDVTTVN